MSVKDFVNSIYVGDRICTALTLNYVQKNVSLTIDLISRIRSESGQWEFYADEDIENGSIVFCDVTEFELQNDGHMPNDSVNSIEVLDESDGMSRIEISISSIGDEIREYECLLRLRCRQVGIENPSKPGELIVE